MFVQTIYSFADQLKLNVDKKKFYLNVIKEISVTDSFLAMDKNIRGCQEESYDECTTRKYKENLENKCQCLPFQMRITEEVVKFQFQ